MNVIKSIKSISIGKTFTILNFKRKLHYIFRSLDYEYFNLSIVNTDLKPVISIKKPIFDRQDIKHLLYDADFITNGCAYILEH